MPKHLLTLAACLVLLTAACSRPERLTPEIAESVVKDRLRRPEPAYAEVPQRVWYGPKSPKDEYDGRAVETLRNLEKAGLITVTHSREADGTEVYQGKVTPKGFRILGTMPSARGPVFRGRIATKKYDGIRNFVSHPTDPTVGSGQLIWHYEDPTPLYDLFTTKMDKPVGVPFQSLVSFYWKDHRWRADIVVKKDRAEPQ